MRTVIIEAKVKLVVRADEDVEISEIIDEMEYSFNDTTTKADIEDSEITDWTVVDSR